MAQHSIMQGCLAIMPACECAGTAAPTSRWATRNATPRHPLPTLSAVCSLGRCAVGEGGCSTTGAAQAAASFPPLGLPSALVIWVS